MKKGNMLVLLITRKERDLNNGKSNMLIPRMMKRPRARTKTLDSTSTDHSILSPNCG
jgi:hypothetical protein